MAQRKTMASSIMDQVKKEKTVTAEELLALQQSKLEIYLNDRKVSLEPDTKSVILFHLFDQIGTSNVG